MTPQITGYIQVDDGIATGLRVGWTGPWPPPEEMVAVEGRITPPTIFERESLEGYVEQMLRMGFTIEVLKRVRYSPITDEQLATMTRVARGSEYVRDREWP